jgi:hypothetical protein
MIDLVLGYNEANTSALFKFLLSKVGDHVIHASST